MTDEDELEKLREERIEEMKEKQSEEQMEAQREAQKRAEAQKKAMLRKYLEPEARERLNAIKMTKPQFAEQVEKQVVALAQSGRIQGKIDDQKMKQILKELQPDDNDYNIRRR